MTEIEALEDIQEILKVAFAKKSSGVVDLMLQMADTLDEIESVLKAAGFEVTEEN